MVSAAAVCCTHTNLEPRSYLFVEDVAEAFDMVLHKGELGEVYNIGTEKERSVLDVSGTCCCCAAAATARCQ
jgi:dTDP-D-glucose 4,6-dehydratase